jgi:hypothetical protein
MPSISRVANSALAAAGFSVNLEAMGRPDVVIQVRCSYNVQHFTGHGACRLLTLTTAVKRSS